ncbi:NAD(P)-binding protein [Leucogyrophana mollusca]|uniref:NAD(P)-binding protein n=1 Tax=Leucogyrophana mollusca TaxID=85980 RepID=A0ACB8BM69_9AGAM|nr:NAD(P)-binding protein [Leucogyrophana mollusca]
MFFKKKWNPRGLHVYITGGSQGLGLALAILVAKKGAHVSIVARTQSKLEKALIELEAVRQSPDQIFRSYSFALDNAESSAAALKAASEGHGGQVPDAVITCAGASKPMFLLDMEEQDLTQGMINGYWVQAWTAFAAAKQMAREGKKGKIVLVSSTLGFMSFVGYSSYSPAKHALRGLAEALHSELMLYGIDTHIFFPPTMYTPGFDEENKTKPAITRTIESTDEGLTAEQAASALLIGVENGEAHITGDLITSLFRASTRGAAPRSNAALDVVYDFIALIGVPIWRRSVDKQVLAHREEHQQYLQKKGFF